MVNRRLGLIERLADALTAARFADIVEKDFHRLIHIICQRQHFNVTRADVAVPFECFFPPGAPPPPVLFA